MWVVEIRRFGMASSRRTSWTRDTRRSHSRACSSWEMHARGGLHPGVLHVSTRHLCFESALHTAALTKLPLAAVASVELCRDPLFHLIPNGVRVTTSEGTALVFASLIDREATHAMLNAAMHASRSVR